MRKCQAELSDIARIVVISFVKCECQAELVIFCKDILGKCLIFCYVDKSMQTRVKTSENKMYGCLLLKKRYTNSLFVTETNNSLKTDKSMTAIPT